MCRTSTKPRLTLIDGIQLENISHTFIIKDTGPSSIKNLDVLLEVPVSHLDPWKKQSVIVIDFKKVSVTVRLYLRKKLKY